MEQERAVVKIMDSIYRLAPKLTAAEQEVITHHIRLAFGAGYDEGSGERTSKPIKQTKNGIEIQRFPSIKIASNITKISTVTISNSLHGRTKICADGTKWEYVVD